jgi:hypothetical protein
MFSQRDTGDRDKKNQDKREIDPFRILAEDLGRLDLVKRQKQ